MNRGHDKYIKKILILYFYIVDSDLKKKEVERTGDF
jgi:hypothetical protein